MSKMIVTYLRSRVFNKLLSDNIVSELLVNVSKAMVLSFEQIVKKALFG